MDRPIRILHCVVKLDRGGAETLLMNIYRNTDRNRIQFDFLYSIDGAFTDEIKKLGGKAYKIPYITDVGPFEYSKQVYNFFKKHDEYRIVHSHMDRMSGLIMREAKNAGVPVRIAHSHSTQCSGSILIRLIKKYYSMYLRNANFYFACSEAAAEFMFKGKSAAILKNGIESNRFIYNPEIRENLRKKLNCENKFVIGHVGNFGVPKNHGFLIEVFNELHRKCDNAELVLIGTGTLQENIRNKVESLGLDDCVHFLGSCSNVNKWLNAFDVFLFPSLYEGLGIAVIEAQASGLKCIVSDTVTREIDITGNIEFISLNDKPARWADVIMKYQSGHERKNMKKCIAESGYDIAATVKFLEEFYINEYEKLS